MWPVGSCLPTGNPEKNYPILARHDKDGSLPRTGFQVSFERSDTACATIVRV